MKTTKAGRTVLREAAEWEVDFQKKAFKETPTNGINSNYCIDLLDDIDTLTTRLTQAEAMLERVPEMFEDRVKVNVETEDQAEWKKDYEEFKK